MDAMDNGKINFSPASAIIDDQKLQRRLAVSISCEM
jgi:hypothetical protein